MNRKASLPSSNPNDAINANRLTQNQIQYAVVGGNRVIGSNATISGGG